MGVKPRNVVRVSGRWRLIYMDLAHEESADVRTGAAKKAYLL